MYYNFAQCQLNKDYTQFTSTQNALPTPWYFTFIITNFSDPVTRSQFGLTGEYGELSFNDFILYKVILKQCSSYNQNQLLYTLKVISSLCK